MDNLKHYIAISLTFSLPVFFSLQNSFADELNLYLKNISADSVETVLLVDKSQQRLLVLKSAAPQNIQIIDTFRISTGKVNGNKEKEGDQKTPEGIYKIISAIPGTQLPAKYGPMAFVLDYPNRVDKIQHRNGSNIWIHGRDEEIVDRQTEGCVSLENGKLLELSDYITLQKTPVIIIDSLYHNGHSSAVYQKFTGSDSLIANWLDLWKKGDIEGFARLFSENFKTQSWNNKRLYLNNKKQLETVYNWKDISTDKLWILQSDHEALIHFQQEYLCPTFFSRG
ncbi:MAG: L,D-transpeptidase family protein, partial [Candidatus Marinimicrobia bacterium]|nr:L,D-transpeptidase family protein [Candidatus Neomarinimicrobiota bacterium]